MAPVASLWIKLYGQSRWEEYARELHDEVLTPTRPAAKENPEIGQLVSLDAVIKINIGKIVKYRPT